MCFDAIFHPDEHSFPIDEFHKVVAGNWCFDIANNYGISLSLSIPVVKSDCSGLQASKYVCVDV